jgi:UDP-sugar transporter A1/2/3
VVASVVRYADNIVKGFGSAISIVIGSVLSVYIFGVRLSNQFVLGAALVVFSVFIYSSGVKLVGWKQHKKLVRGIRTP